MRTLTYDFEYGDTNDVATINSDLAALRLSSVEVLDINPYLTVAMENAAGNAFRPKTFFRLGIHHLELSVDEEGEDTGVWQIDAQALRRGTVEGGEAYIDAWALTHPDLEPESMMQFAFEGDDVDCFVVFATIAPWTTTPLEA